MTCKSLLSVLFSLASVSVLAQGPTIFVGADLQLGAQLIANNQCVACHQRKVGGDGSAIYQSSGRITTPGGLRGMIEQCNMELNLALFPEEVSAISAVLNLKHYQFK